MFHGNKTIVVYKEPVMDKTTSKVVENKNILNLPSLELDGDEETLAFVNLSQEQLEQLKNDVEHIKEKYLYHSADEIFGVAVVFAKRDGALTPATLFDYAHKLMSCDCRLAAVKAPSVEALAERIIKGVDDAINSINDAINSVEYKCVKCTPDEFHNACNVWDYVRSNGWGRVFTQESESYFKAVVVTYCGDNYVVCETCTNLSTIM